LFITVHEFSFRSDIKYVKELHKSYLRGIHGSELELHGSQAGRRRVILKGHISKTIFY
jgi:hypothetical protein